MPCNIAIAPLRAAIKILEKRQERVLAFFEVLMAYYIRLRMHREEIFAATTISKFGHTPLMETVSSRDDTNAVNATRASTLE
jgi:hypothetical protein